MTRLFPKGILLITIIEEKIRKSSYEQQGTEEMVLVF